MTGMVRKDFTRKQGRRQGQIVDGSVELPPSSRSRSETVWFEKTRNVVRRPNELHKRSEIEKRVEYFERVRENERNSYRERRGRELLV